MFIYLFLLDHKINYFAYPFGTASDVNSHLLSLMELSGYEAAFTSITGLNANLNSNYQFVRIAPLGNENINQFLSRLYLAEEIGAYKKAIHFLHKIVKN